MSQPLEDFYFDWQCVAESLEAEQEATEKARSEAKSGSSPPTMSFEEWQRNANEDMNAGKRAARADRLRE